MEDISQWSVIDLSKQSGMHHRLAIADISQRGIPLIECPFMEDKNPFSLFDLDSGIRSRIFLFTTGQKEGQACE